MMRSDRHSLGSALRELLRCSACQPHTRLAFVQVGVFHNGHTPQSLRHWVMRFASGLRDAAVVLAFGDGE
jgi:hypothetical protein